jgi:hypothetical protein
MKKNDARLKMELAVMHECCNYLYIKDMISEAENDKIHKRIKKFQDKHKIEISEDELYSVTFVCDNKKSEI